MKTILISVLLQILPGPDADSSEIRVMAAVTAEFDSREACKNAIVGMVNLAEASGFKVNSLCAPKDIGKLRGGEAEGEAADPASRTGVRAWVCFLASRSARAAC